MFSNDQDQKDLVLNQTQVEEIDLLLHQEPVNQVPPIEKTTGTTKKQTATSKTAIPESIANESTKQMVGVLTELFTQLNENNLNKQQQNEKQKVLEIENRVKDRSGLAIAEFKRKMDEEIKRGDYIEWPYYNQAERTGAIVTVCVNGYSLVFINGYSTVVPKSLKKEVDQYFKSFSNSRNSLSRIMVSSTTSLNGPIDANATNEVITHLQNELPK